MRYLFLILVTFIIGCTKENHMDQDSISFEFSKEAISSIDLIQNQTTRHLFDSNIDTKDELFSKSWISMIKTTQNFNRELVIEVEEHKPIAKLNEGRFFTQVSNLVVSGGIACLKKVNFTFGVDLLAFSTTSGTKRKYNYFF